MESRDMKISLKGILEIAEHEGIVPAPYWDSAGVLTFGVGHTRFAGGVKPSEIPLTMPSNVYELDAAVQRAVEIFQKDLKSYEARVNKAIKVPLEQHQFDALVSWDFNTGGALWRHPVTGAPAKLVQEINSGDLSGNGFMGWLRPVEIKKRRVAEQALFQTGSYDRNGDKIPLWETDGKGKLIGVLRSLSGDELLKRFITDEKPKPTIVEKFINWFLSWLGKGT